MLTIFTDHIDQLPPVPLGETRLFLAESFIVEVCVLNPQHYPETQSPMTGPPSGDPCSLEALGRTLPRVARSGRL